MFIPIRESSPKSHHSALKKSIELKEKGKTETQIFKETLILLHPDAECSIEISDHKAKIHPNSWVRLDEIKKKISENIENFRNGNVDQDKATQINQTLIEEKKVLEKRLEDIQSGKIEKGVVSFYMEHDKLYELYPEAKDIKLKFFDEDSVGCGGYIDIIENTYSHSGVIHMGKSSLNDPELFKNRLLHEIQHIIQMQNRWTNGIGADAFIPLENELSKQAHIEYESLDIKKLSERILDNYLNSTSRFKEPLSLINNGLTKEEITIINNYTLCLKEGENSHTRYRSTYGEIQAYSTGERMNMTMSERKKTHPLHSQKQYMKNPIIGLNYLVDKRTLDMLTKKVVNYIKKNEMSLSR